ncbi:splicing factor u2af large subunit a [Phtheirospermum japonicum]|uniref:Splicing factor U2af large subunit n=1 Tax=Phtheirospermum japonicum TaxID=374723 RepID=A0A830CJD3_9LAMI|nr:splicing factor u2af large subunit a [Phtheirospermum japonicum]
MIAGDRHLTIRRKIDGPIIRSTKIVIQMTRDIGEKIGARMEKNNNIESKTSKLVDIMGEEVTMRIMKIEETKNQAGIIGMVKIEKNTIDRGHPADQIINLLASEQVVLMWRHLVPLLCQIHQAFRPAAEFHLGWGSKQVTGVSMAPQPISGVLQNMHTSDITQSGSVSMFPVQVMTQQATRFARRVYVGGLPPLANEQTIARFFSHVMNAVGGNSAGPGDAVVNVYINHEKKFAFVEMRTVEEASNAMALDGLSFEGVTVRVRRPTDYIVSAAAPLGPSQPSPYLNLAAVGLTPGTTSDAEGADRIFLGGVPYYFSEAQIKELLESFGPLRGLDLVKDRDTGNSKGYGFCIYKDPSVTDMACAALNGLKVGDKTLTVRRATQSGQLKPEQEDMLVQAQQHIAIQKMALGVGAMNNLPDGGIEPVVNVEVEIPTKILCLSEAVTTDELMDDGEYEEILEDMKEECQKFGELIDVVIPRPIPNAAHSEAIGKVFLEYSDTAGCTKAKTALGGRKFGGNSVVALYYPEDKYYGGDYTCTA